MEKLVDEIYLTAEKLHDNLADLRRLSNSAKGCQVRVVYNGIEYSYLNEENSSCEKVKNLLIEDMKTNTRCSKHDLYLLCRKFIREFKKQVKEGNA